MMLERAMKLQFLSSAAMIIGGLILPCLATGRFSKGQVIESVNNPQAMGRWVVTAAVDYPDEFKSGMGSPAIKPFIQHLNPGETNCLIKH